MLKQLSVFQNILGVIILLFVWSLFTEYTSAKYLTLTDNHRH